MRHYRSVVAALAAALSAACIPGELTLAADGAAGVDGGGHDAFSADAGRDALSGDAARDSSFADAPLSGVCVFDNPNSSFDRGCTFGP